MIIFHNGEYFTSGGGEGLILAGRVTYIRNISGPRPSIVKDALLGLYSPPSTPPARPRREIYSGVFLGTLKGLYPWVWVPKPWNMALKPRALQAFRVQA